MSTIILQRNAIKHALVVNQLNPVDEQIYAAGLFLLTEGLESITTKQPLEIIVKPFVSQNFTSN